MTTLPKEAIPQHDSREQIFLGALCLAQEHDPIECENDCPLCLEAKALLHTTRQEALEEGKERETQAYQRGRGIICGSYDHEQAVALALHQGALKALEAVKEAGKAYQDDGPHAFCAQEACADAAQRIVDSLEPRTEV